MDTAVLVALVGGGCTLLGGGIAGLVSLKVSKRQLRPAVIAADAAVQQQINEGFEKLARQYTARNAELMEELGKTRAELAEANRKLDEALTTADQLTGELRDLTQHVESLENALRQGRQIPARRRRPHPLAKPPLAIIPDPDKSGE